MWNRVLLTGAAGRLGGYLRNALAGRFPVLRVTDRQELGPVREGEEALVGDLSDPAFAARVVEGADAVLHFAGMSGIHPFDALLPANILSVHHLYEQARFAGIRRVIFASSNHVTGFHPSSATIGPGDPVRPDTLYGVTKVFGEALARLYFDKYGIEALCIRIGSCFPEPTSARMLTTWLSRDDLARLVQAGLDEPRIGYRIVYGVSANPTTFWQEPQEALPNFIPRDSAQAFADRFSQDQGDSEPFQGGHFTRSAF